MQELADEIELQKALAIKNRERPNRLFLTCVMAGVFLSGFIVVAFNTAYEITLFCGFVISMLLGVALGQSKPSRLAGCPKCNFDCEIREDVTQNLLTWTSCPGCGLGTAMDRTPGNQTEWVSCYCCSGGVPRNKAKTMWRLPILVLTLVHMHPEDEGNKLYCRKCIGSLNLSVCLLALLGAFMVYENPWLHSEFVAAVSAGGCLLTWFLLRRRRARNLKAKKRSIELANGSRERRAH